MWVKTLNGNLINLNMCAFVCYNPTEDKTFVKLATDRLYGDFHPIANGDKTIEVIQRLAATGSFMDFTKGD